MRPTTGLLLEGSPVAEYLEGLCVMAGVMERFSDETMRDAWLVQLQAETLAGVDLPRSAASLVPPRWTAWLLMERAGVPHDLIAHVCRVSPGKIRRRVRRAKLLMLLPPYSAHVFRLTGQMTPFGKPHVPTLKPVQEAACADLAG